MEKLIAIIGPTASGKTRKAVALANRMDGEIISADSRQVYRSMDIGTGKDLDEYGNIPYHLIDICPPGYKYNLYEYLRDYETAYATVRAHRHIPIICGGTGMYVEAILNGIKLPNVPENKELREKLNGKTLIELTDILSKMKVLHNSTDVDTAKRAIRAIEIQTYYIEHPEEQANTRPKPVKNPLIVGLSIDRERRRIRISNRLQHRLETGLVEEIKGLLTSGLAPEDLIYYGLEYKFVTNYVIGNLSYEQMKEQLEIAIHQFAKRQMTWFRGMERRGFKIHWLPYDMPDNEFTDCVCSLYKEP